MKKGFLILFCLAVMGIAKAQQQGNHWTPVGLEHNMTVSGIIFIDGNEQMVSTLEVGAFCGEQCRGSRRGQYFSMTGQYVVPLQIQGNANGEVITFRLYDHVTQQELDLESVNTLEFEINGRIGAPGNWYSFGFNSPAQTFTLPITGYGNSAGGYYLIAPPFDDINPAEIEGMTNGDYDLYYFDQSQAGEEWRNYEAEPFNLESGKGYLYAHKTDVTLNFTGTPYSGNGQVTLSKTEGVPFAGWNLVGNPYAQTATIGNRPFYVMREDGGEIIVAKTTNIDPMQGIFVIAAEDGETLTFSTSNGASHSSRIVLSLLHRRNVPIDRAIVRFNEDGSLPKMMLHPNSTKLYLHNEGKDYAVVNAGRDGVHTVSTEVNFKAAENGTYTLSVDLDNLELDYLHLIDNKTGADVDLLLSPSYTFEASTTDNVERFRLAYATTTSIEEKNESFAYYANGEILLTDIGEGTDDVCLQIVDVTGRILVSHDGRMRCVPTGEITPGVYILHLINGDDVRIQKMVIR